MEDVAPNPECATASAILTNFSCLLAFFSSILPFLLGYGIVAASILLKVPQILSIVRAKSAAGVSRMMYQLEVLGYIVTLAYSFRREFPFSAYGEYVFIVIQNIVILFLMYFYEEEETEDEETKKEGGSSSSSSSSAVLKGFVPLFVLILILFGLFFFVLNMVIVDWFMWFNVILFTVARLPQVYSNWANSSVGALSFITYFMNVGGSATRIFTTLSMEGEGTTVVLVGFVIGGVINVVIFSQIVWYSYLGFGKKVKVEDEKESESEGKASGNDRAEPRKEGDGEESAD